MASKRPKPWKRCQANGRIRGIRNRRRVLILCEDEKSARLYFKGFKLDKRRVEVLAIGSGMNTDSLVQKAIDLKEKAAQYGEPFNEIWCVFDRDSFPAQNFNRAFQLADNHGIFVAWANEAFEIWYLLHFNYHDTGISRADYGGRLSARLGCEYDKADDQIYARLESHQGAAMKHAQRLERHWVEMGGYNRENANPSTNIHKLVEFLNEFKEIGSADGD
jgi:hypothetical protein